MARSSYKRVDIWIPNFRVDDVVQACWELDTVGIEESNGPATTRLTAFFENTNRAEVFEGSLRRLLKTRQLEVEDLAVSVVDDDPEEWIRQCRANFESFAATESIFIHPPWQEPSEDFEVNILLEPGRAFGTGTHESTRLALEVLERQKVRSSAAILDVGTGSGILTIAARKLFPGSRVYACDTDPEAVFAARENLLRNHILGTHIFAGSVPAIRKRFDLVVANLTLGIFRSVGGGLAGLAKSRIILSGITGEQVDSLVAHFQSLVPFRLQEVRSLNGWVALCLELEDTREGDIFREFQAVPCTEHF